MKNKKKFLVALSVIVLLIILCCLFGKTIYYDYFYSMHDSRRYYDCDLTTHHLEYNTNTGKQECVEGEAKAE